MGLQPHAPIWRTICGAKGMTDFTGQALENSACPNMRHFTRLDTLDERWTPENIRRSMGKYAFGNRRAYISYPAQMPQELSDWFRLFHKTSHIYKLYLVILLPAGGTYRSIPTTCSPCPYLKRGLAEAGRAVGTECGIWANMTSETFDDPVRRPGEASSGIWMPSLPAAQAAKQNTPCCTCRKETLRQERQVTEQITTLRKQLKLNQGIEARSVQIQEKDKICSMPNEYRAKEAQQQKKAQRREARRTMTTDNEIYTQLDRITGTTARPMTKQERPGVVSRRKLYLCTAR